MNKEKTPKAGKMISLERKPMQEGDNMDGIAVSVSKPEGPDYPTAYVSHPSLPKMKVGQKVKLHGVVKGFTERTHSSSNKGQGPEDIENDNSADIDLHHIEPMNGEEDEGKPKKSKSQEDDEAIEQGLAAAENNNEG